MQVGLIGLKLDGFSANGDHFTHAAYLEGSVDTRDVIGCDRDVLGFKLRETRRDDLDVINARRKVAGIVGSAVVSFGFGAETGGIVP